MGISSVLAVAGPIIGGLIGGGGATQAADTQSQAAAQAAFLQNQQFQQVQANLQPYMQAGTTSLAGLRGLLGLPADASAGGGAYNWNAPLTKSFGMEDFAASPAYQFNLQEGQKAIDKAAAARGNYYAPATLRDVSRFSQGLASNEFQNAYQNYVTNQQNLFNRLYSVSGAGQNAAANLGGFGAATAGNVGNLLTGSGAAQAAGQVGQANALSGAVSGAYNNYTMNQILRQLQQPSYTNYSDIAGLGYDFSGGPAYG